MLRISTVQNGNDSLKLLLEGSVAGDWVAELRTTCERLLSEGRSLQLDLAEVSYLDQNGLALFSNLRARGVMLLECSPFVKEQLRNPAEDAAEMPGQFDS
jgi:ABC-type transporter Mla MlaB component